MSAAPMREPPHSIEAERAVLGSILLDTTGGDGDRVWDVCQSRGVQPDSFFDPRNRVLYAAMEELCRASKLLDYVSLLDALRTSGKLEAIGGAVYLQSLYDGTPTTAHAEYYIDLVLKKHLRRKVIERSMRAIEKCYDENNYPDPQFVLGEAEKSLLEIDPANGASGLTWAQATDKAYTAITNPEPGDRGLPSGFRTLDEKIGRFEKGTLNIIAARPSVGKTALALNIVEHLALGKTRHPVGVFTMEMPMEKLTERMIYSRARVNSWRHKHNDFDDLTAKANADAAVAKARDEVRAAPIFPDDTPSLDVADLRARARRMKKQHGIELVVIDYLQLMSCREAAGQNRNLEVAGISKRLKAMAKELKIPVIALSQLNREGDGKEPNLADLRDSGAIEQDADVVMMMWRPDNKDRTHISVKVEKNRNGETSGGATMNFAGAECRFSDQPTAS